MDLARIGFGASLEKGPAQNVLPQLRGPYRLGAVMNCLWERWLAGRGVGRNGWWLVGLGFGAMVILAGCATTTRPGAAAPRKGDEMVVAGQFFHTGTPIVLWMDPGGYDGYRV